MSTGECTEVVLPRLPMGCSRSGWAHARTLLVQAQLLHDRPGSSLPAAARRAASAGFEGGGAWMARALAEIRQRDDTCLVDERLPFARIGITKYALAVLGAIAAGWPATALSGNFWIGIVAAAVGFYLVEVQMVFAFPAAIDGATDPLRRSRRLVSVAGGTIPCFFTVVRIAAFMLFGWMTGGGPLRAWCVGCLAVCLWYEEARSIGGRSDAPARWQWGDRTPLLVREETVDLVAPSREIASLRMLYASDLHLGRRWTQRVPAQLLRAVDASRPDVILLGGDLVDHRRGLDSLSDLTTQMVRAGMIVCAVAGNHDVRAGEADVSRAVRSAGGVWLDDAPVHVAPGVRLYGVSSSMQLMSHELSPDDRVRLLCAHDPAVMSESAGRFDVVFAGHLHGGQWALFRRGTRSYPGAWINRWTGLRFEPTELTRYATSTPGVCPRLTTLLVSRGAADTFPVRWNCPREVVLCTVHY